MPDATPELFSNTPGPQKAQLALAEVYLLQGRWAELGQLLAALENDRGVALPCTLLRARAHLARLEFAAARTLLGEAVVHWPREVAVRLLLAQVHLEEGSDPAAAEQALVDALTLDPTNDQALRSLLRLHSRIALQWGAPG